MKRQGHKQDTERQGQKPYLVRETRRTRLLWQKVSSLFRQTLSWCLTWETKRVESWWMDEISSSGAILEGNGSEHGKCKECIGLTEVSVFLTGCCTNLCTDGWLEMLGKHLLPGLVITLVPEMCQLSFCRSGYRLMKWLPSWIKNSMGSMDWILTPKMSYRKESILLNIYLNR